MGRKKRKGVELKPFCFYCDREFDDEKVLVQHQKAKHFKCVICNRKLDTATGLFVHMRQVHKDSITKVPNALSGRDNPELIINGMNGVPPEALLEKQAKVKEAIGVKDAAKMERVNWAQVQMAPNIQNLQQMMAQMQQQANPNGARIPPHLGMMPTLPGLPAMPLPPPFPGIGGFPGLPMPGPMGNMFPPPQMHPQNGVMPLLPPSGGGHMPMSTHNHNIAPPGSSPISSTAQAPNQTSQFSTNNGAATGTYSAAPSISSSSNGAAISNMSHPNSSPAARVTQQPTSPPVQCGPPGPPPQVGPMAKPPNVRLVYDDDMVSPEEKRAMLTCNYKNSS